MPSDSSEPVIDDVLFSRFQQGNEEAFALVIAHFQNRLIGFLRVCCPSREMAEELAQDTFLKLHQQRERIYSADKILPWMMVTARRLAIRETDRWRRRGEIPLTDEVICGLADAIPARQRDRTEREHAARVLAECLNELKPGDRELIMLRYFSDLKLKDISETLSMPMGSVGVKLRRSLDRLGKRLSERGVHQEDLL